MRPGDANRAVKAPPRLRNVACWLRGVRGRRRISGGVASGNGITYVSTGHRVAHAYKIVHMSVSEERTAR
eukprot:1737599-Rhodomonas_salina.2